MKIIGHLVVHCGVLWLWIEGTGWLPLSRITPTPTTRIRFDADYYGDYL